MKSKVTIENWLYLQQCLIYEQLRVRNGTPYIDEKEKQDLFSEMNHLHKSYYREQLVVRKKLADKDQKNQDREKDYLLIPEAHLFLGHMFRYVEQIALKTRCNPTYFSYIATFLHSRSRESESLVESIAHSFFIDLVHYENNEQELLSVIHQLIDQNLPRSYLLDKLLHYYTKKKSQRKFLKLIFKKELREILINQDKIKNISFDPQTVYENIQTHKAHSYKLKPNRVYVKKYNLQDAFQDWEVERTLEQHSEGIIRHTRNLVDEVVHSFKSIPQGIRGICLRLYKAHQDERVVCDFLFYKWWLPAIVDPVNYEIFHSISVHKSSIKYLLTIATIIRHICNNTRFHERGYHYINQFIETKVSEVQTFIRKITCAEDFKRHSPRNTLGLPQKHMDLMKEINKFKVISVVLSIEDIMYIASIIWNNSNAFQEPQWKLLVKFANILKQSDLSSLIKANEKTFLYFSLIEWGNSFIQDTNQEVQSAPIRARALSTVEEINYIQKSQELIKKLLINLDFSSIAIKDLSLMGILTHTNQCSYAYEGKKALQSMQSLPLMAQFLKSCLEKIPRAYAKRGFNLLYQEMISDIDDRFKNLSKDLKLNRKILLLALEYTKKHVKDIQAEAKIKSKTNLYELINSFKVSACIIAKVKNNSMFLLVFSSEECPHSRVKYVEDLIKGSFLENKEQTHINNISEFPLAFTSKSYVKDCCHSSKHTNMIQQAFFMYIDLLRKKLGTSESVIEGIEKYLTMSLYPYVFPEEPSDEDTAFYYKTLELEWIRPEHLDIDCKDDEIWNVAIACISNIDKEKNPLQKVQCFEQCVNTIVDMLTLLSDHKSVGADDSFPVSVYVLIKAKLRRFHSNINFIEIFTDNRKLTGAREFALIHFQNAAAFIRNINEDLLSISPEEYKTYCENSRSSTEV